MINLIFMIVFIVAALGLSGFAIFKAVKLVKNATPAALDYVSEIKKIFFVIIGVIASTILAPIFFVIYKEFPLTFLGYLQMIIGSLFFGFSLPTFIVSFILHYYGKEIPKNIDKFLFIWLISTIFGMLLGLVLLTNGFADFLTYPLVNGLSFSAGFVRPNSASTPTVAWYALCILSGALLAYFISDHRFYKEYGQHGILESTFFVAFPAGIIGARIGYVIGEWNHGGANSFASRVANGEWWAPFAIWEGGITILAGAIAGIVVGALWFLWRNKKYSLALAFDIVVPTILIAQAVGRWGNFFNCEVHGLEVSRSYWEFLPKIILNNLAYSDSAGFASTGNIYVPLFLIECSINLLGYLFIRVIVGKLCKKYLELGDLGYLYIAWYGLTRVFLEPLRYPSYNMGEDGYWSWFWSFLFVLVAAIAIAVNHIVRTSIRRKKGTYIQPKNSVKLGIVSTIIFAGVGTIFTILGIVLMANGTPSLSIEYSMFNLGLISLLGGISFYALIGTSVPFIVPYNNKEIVYEK